MATICGGKLLAKDPSGSLLLAGSLQVPPWLLALLAGSLLAPCWLLAGSLLVPCWLLFGCSPFRLVCTRSISLRSQVSKTINNEAKNGMIL